MPRSMQELIKHADRLADGLEQSKTVGRRIDPAERRELQELTAAVLERARAERSVQAAVKRAREQGRSWALIGKVLGTSAQAAQQRFKPVVPAKSTAKTVTRKSSAKSVTGKSTAKVGARSSTRKRAS
jgi:hypothetical protein